MRKNDKQRVNEIKKKRDRGVWIHREKREANRIQKRKGNGYREKRRGRFDIEREVTRKKMDTKRKIKQKDRRI